MGTDRGRAYAALAVSIVGWALAPVFIRQLSQWYDPYVQSWVRYSSAAVALLPWCWYRWRSSLYSCFERWRVLLMISLLVVVLQTAWTVAVYHTTSTMAQLLSKLHAPLVILFSYAVFREERGIIANWKFLSGAVLSLVGAMLVVMRLDGAHPMLNLDLAFWLLMLVNVCWALYIVASRYTCKALQPASMFAVVALMTGLLFTPVALALGEPRQLVDAGLGALTIGFISGAVSISLSHSMFHYAQVRLGAAFSTTMQLSNPLITYAVAVLLWPDEGMALWQWIGAAALIGGGALVVNAREIPDPDRAG
ncbi:MAG TPA: DMT family transporter [Candidatus Hydrogenedentes bacterium]|nr:DMT family transporter [Candidatus Hydrogenedentota bacterium]